MFYITAVATGCKRNPSNLTNINIVTEPTAVQAEKVTTGETTSNALPSVKNLSGSVSQEEKKEEEEEEGEENIQELVEAEQVLEEEIKHLEKEEKKEKEYLAMPTAPPFSEMSSSKV
ncbi:hypothetical protein ACRRVD_01885 [Candidatus Cardinium hertigii]|uniref:hypothetical protein n=1 Tax=Candidatus Cardinium hertigii TaxID=247481 RepID=UPI003D7C49A1